MCLQGTHPSFEEAGKVEIRNLPRHGNTTPIPDVSLQSDAAFVCRTLMAQLEPTILVRYSIGGVIISRVSEKRLGKHNILNFSRTPRL